MPRENHRFTQYEESTCSELRAALTHLNLARQHYNKVWVNVEQISHYLRERHNLHIDQRTLTFRLNQGVRNRFVKKYKSNRKGFFYSLTEDGDKVINRQKDSDFPIKQGTQVRDYYKTRKNINIRAV